MGKSSDKMYYDSGKDKMIYHGDFVIVGDLEIHGNLTVEGVFISKTTKNAHVYKSKLLKTKWDLVKALFRS